MLTKCENSVTRALPEFAMLSQVQILLHFPCEALPSATQCSRCSSQSMTLVSRAENGACEFVPIAVFH